MSQYINFFGVHKEYKAAQKVLEIGVGLGRSTRQIFEDKGEVYSVDISESALKGVSDFAYPYTTAIAESDIPKIDTLPTGVIDIAFSFLVCQHISDEMLSLHLLHVVRSLKESGLFCLQYAVDINPDKSWDRQSNESQMKGGVLRKQEHMESLATAGQAKIINRNAGQLTGVGATGSWEWRGIILGTPNE